MKRCFTLVLGLLSAAVCCAQDEIPDDGITLGRVHIAFDAGAGAVYDNRAVTTDSGIETDFYSEVEAGCSLRNLPARYQLSANASYGYRLYSEYTDINDDFYSVGAGAKTGGESPLQWGVSSAAAKVLEYETSTVSGEGGVQDSVLTDAPNLRWRSGASVNYDIRTSEKLSLVPGYELGHYYERLTDDAQTEIADWLTHRAELEGKYLLSDKTSVSAGASYTIQVNSFERGSVASVYFGGESQFTDKTSGELQLGFSSGDYEESGSSSGGISDLRLLWRPQEPLNFYVFGGNDYQPGYSSGNARMVYRFGYGFSWGFLSRMSLTGSGYHSREQELGEKTGNYYEGFRHFYKLSCSYRLKNSIALTLGGAYTEDEIDEDRVSVSMKLNFTY